MKTIQKVALASLVASTATAAADASAALNAYLKIDGIQGDSTVTGEEGAIKIEAFEFSATAATDANTGLASGKRQFSPIVIQKHVDGATVGLMRAFLSGRAVRTAEVDFRRAEMPGQPPSEYLKIQMDDIIVSSYSLGGHGGGEPTEQISFNFGALKVEFTGTTANGGTNTATQSVGFDLATLKVE
jgi:type VI secretion system Hcp family effector